MLIPPACHANTSVPDGGLVKYIYTNKVNIISVIGSASNASQPRCKRVGVRTRRGNRHHPSVLTLSRKHMLAAKLKGAGKMNDHESRISALEAARKEIEESLIVMAHLETKQSNLIKEQAEYMAEHEKRLRESEKQNREIDKRIADLVSAIGEWIRRTQ